MDVKEQAFSWVDAHRDDRVDLWRRIIAASIAIFAM